MDKKTLRAPIETGSVKALHIIAVGPLFHVEVITTRQRALAALTGKGTQDVENEPLRVARVFAASPTCGQRLCDEQNINCLAAPSESKCKVFKHPSARRWQIFSRHKRIPIPANIE
jgi:hypothetical protein